MQVTVILAVPFLIPFTVPLEDTVANALQQINEKDYDCELLSRGIQKENIFHYGFAFEGKKVLIG